jgi:glyoxylase-like metal-dependent hydrolase (beta-lactamase superfamily II)
MAFQVHELACGSFCPIGMNPFPCDHFSCRCLLIETSTGLVLCDTGMPSKNWLTNHPSIGNVVRQTLYKENKSAADHVRALGFSTEEVRHIIVTHLDADHAGGMMDFPNAKVHLHANEYALSQNIPAKQKHRFLPELWVNAKLKAYDNFGDVWNGFRCVRQLEGLPPEILLVPLTGHTKGHSGIAVESEKGWILHAGDAFYFQEDLSGSIKKRNLASDSMQALLASSNIERALNLFQISRLQKNNRELILTNSHDPRLGLSQRERIAD